MGTLSIKDQGLQRIAQALHQFELDEPAGGYPAEPDVQQMEQDIEALHQWVDYFMESKTLTEQEIQDLKSQFEFLESHVYDQPGLSSLKEKVDQLGAPAAPAATPQDMKDTDKGAPKNYVPSDADSKKWWQW